MENGLFENNWVNVESERIVKEMMELVREDLNKNEYQIMKLDIKKGYYWVRFYNHEVKQIMYFNGKGFKGFKSDEFIHDEIEYYTIIESNQQKDSFNKEDILKERKDFILNDWGCIESDLNGEEHDSLHGQLLQEGEFIDWLREHKIWKQQKEKQTKN